VSALVIKTGMSDEARIARLYAAPGTLVLSGIMTVADLRKQVPADCKAIMSFGLCGGLVPSVAIAQIVLASVLVTPDGEYPVDTAWLHRLFAKTRFYEHRWLSTGVFNQADTPEQRAALFAKYGAYVIDDESAAVAQFTKERGIAFTAMRSISDGALDTVPPAARNALNVDGSADIPEVLDSVFADSAQLPDLIKMADQYYESLDTLRRAASLVGPTFQWT
jgi:nucleoside phosphorylase